MTDDLARARNAVDGALRAVVAALGVEAEVRVDVAGEEAEISASVHGGTAEALIGRQGETIDAVQYLMTQIASRAADGGRIRVSLDVDGYRERRAAALRDLAARAAAEALEYGEEIELDPMSPHDRRIVHLELKENPAVATRSEGDEPRRRIIVEPAEE